MLRRLLLALALMSSPAFAEEPASKPASNPSSKPAEEKPAQPGSDKLSVTEHELTVDGKPLKYRATAGTLAMKDEAGKPKADVFFVAYEKLPLAENPSTRPITYVFNGGPGAASVWLHIGTAGPKRLKFTDEGEVPPPPATMVDNEQTWLNSTDLVFIDPVNTGYSRAAQGEDEKQFFGVENDIRWVGEFIRLYTTRYKRWASPKFLAGESYGTTRGAILSEHLLERHGIALNGIVLISSVLDFSTLSPGDSNDLPYALFLPTYTATAGYYKKLPPVLQNDVPAAIKKAEEWATGPYVTALAQGDALPAGQREKVAKALANFTGLSADVIDKANLRIGPNLFRAALLENDRKVIGRFDSRIAGYDVDTLDRRPDFDPSLSSFFAAYAGAFNDYARRELKFESDLGYEVLTDRVQPWPFGPPGSGPLYVADNLRGALAKNPGFKVFVAAGLHDLATPYFAARYTISHMKLSPELRKQVSEHLYDGGHMMYHRIESLKKLNEDIGKFIEQTIRPADAVKEEPSKR